MSKWFADLRASLAPNEYGELHPLSSLRRWVVWGLVLQLIGVGVPAAYVGAAAHRLSVTGHITATSLRLAWRSDAHTGTGVTLLLAGGVIFAVGSVVMARPFVRRRATLFVAVPLAALLGVFVFGVLALLIAALIAGWLDFLDIADFSPDGRRRRRRQTSRSVQHGGARRHPAVGDERTRVTSAVQPNSPLRPTPAAMISRTGAGDSDPVSGEGR